MTLSMKTYKGYNKLPYCNTHYPTTKFTAVADTPENQRLQKNTKNQSGVVYHKEFEQEKGKKTEVADDPETLRLKKNTDNQSLVAYAKKASVSGPAGPPPEVGSDARRYSNVGLVEQPRAAPEAALNQAQQVSAPVAVAAPPPVPEEAPPAAPAGSYVAQYDYTAADDDEVSFMEGDIILNMESIDEGWCTGTVARTGQTGMIPSNYIEAA